MIDVMQIHCPKCSHDFDVDIYVGEEAKNHNAKLTRRAVQHINFAEIALEIEHGNANAILSEGDSISFQLKNGRNVSVSVVAINHYSHDNVVFMFDDLYWKEQMNSRNTNRGGWANSYMADYIESDILPQLPDELANVIVPRKIVQKIGGTAYERKSKLWLPSRTEIFGEHESYKECDFGDKQFPLFIKEKSRVKALEDGTTEWYWLRSPYVGYSTFFWYVSYDGGGGSGDYASNVFGVCPCFIIGKLPDNEVA